MIKRFVSSVWQRRTCSSSSCSLDKEWESFKAKYNKVYGSSAEESYRKSIFVATLEKVNAHNREADNGVHAHRVGINHFADLTQEEFEANYLGFRGRTKSPNEEKS
ncbi:cystein proteinase inhibitor protein salarin-like [Panonychus citri]|uniref:cystein proteinase inhibitor protein salarin-like n=1 Tax=Panonychus citri TaxID=50023 RepID=UPI0023074515|nr:cystein proteinase inhibitor protein salarin-like [Panonychus citri]